MKRGWLIIFAGAVVSALLLAVAFDIPGFSWLAWFALVPWLLALSKAGSRQAFWSGFLWGIVFYGIELCWFLKIFGPAAFVLWSILSFFIGIFGLAVQDGLRRWGRVFLLWGVPIIWTGIDFFRSECWWLRFGWLGLGYSQQGDAIAQVVSIGGIYLLTWLVASGSALVVFMIRGGLKNYAAHALILIMISLLLVGMGAFLPVRDNGVTIKILGFEMESISTKEQDAILQKAIRENPDVKLIVLPEYATAEIVKPSSPTLDRFTEIAARGDALLVFGGREEADGGKGWYNTVFTIDPRGKVVHKQAKWVPVQFFADGLPAKEQRLLSMPEGNVGIMVCYDITFPHVARRLRKLGAELFVVPAMERREWGSKEARQHAGIAKFRAIENRCWLFRVSTSGISQVVDAKGRVLKSLPVDSSEEIISGDVQFIDGTSPYVRFGYLFGPVALAVTVILFAAQLLCSLGDVRRKAKAASTKADRIE